MKISELIDKLIDMKKEKGDLEVGYEFDPYMSNQWIGRIDQLVIVENPDNVIDVPKKDNHKYKGKLLLLQ